MAGVQGYRLFNVQLARKTEISPSLLSLVFSGPEVAQMKSDSPDQRIKMLFPSEDGTPPSLSGDAQWYQAVQGMAKAKRPVVRTYTLRYVDPASQEVTVEFVRHGVEGPASAWAINAARTGFFRSAGSGRLRRFKHIPLCADYLAAAQSSWRKPRRVPD